MMLTLEKAKTILDENLKKRGYKARTIAGRLYYLKNFEAFLLQEQKDDLREIKEEDIYSFIAFLREIISVRTGKPLSGKTLKMILASVKLLFNSLLYGVYKSDDIAAFTALFCDYEISMFFTDHSSTDLQPL